jgi:hypothetical protein
MKSFPRRREPDEALQPMLDSATRTAQFARSAADRAVDGDARNAVGDAAEAVRCAQMMLHEALTAALAAGVPWDELANQAHSFAGYLQPAYETYDSEACMAIPVTARTGWRPLG